MMKRQILTILLILCFSAVASHAEDFGEVEIHGFLAQGFMQSTDNNFFGKTSDGTFEFNEMGINFGTQLTDDLSLGMQFFGRDLGDFGNDEIVIDWIFADYRFKSWLGIRVGKMKSPFGLYNETRDVDMLRTSIFMPQGVYNEGWRDSISAIKGAGAYGHISMGVMGNLSYNLQTGFIDIPTDGGMGKFNNDQGDLTLNSVDVDNSYISALVWETPLEGLRFGVSYTKSKINQSVTSNDGAGWRYRSIVAANGGSTAAADALVGTYGSIDAAYTADLDPVTAGVQSVQGSAADLVGLEADFPLDLNYFVYSVEYVWNDLTLAYEYSIDKTEYDLTSTSGITLVPERDRDLVGWYGSASYRFTELFELGLYYSEFYPDADDKTGSTLTQYGYPKAAGHSRDWCLSTRFDINEYWVIKAEGHMIDGLAVMFMSDQKQVAAGTGMDGTNYDVDDEWFLGAVKISYSF